MTLSQPLTETQAVWADYIMAVVFLLAGLSLVGFAVWITANAWALLGLLAIPRIKIVKDGTPGYADVMMKQREL